MVENTEWGRKTIFTPNDLEEFFQLLYPILKTTPYDDPVLPDFGEIKLNYRSKYYSVITGTGHTAPIFSALQFLEKISESACMDAYTDSLLCYSDCFAVRPIYMSNNDYIYSPIIMEEVRKRWIEGFLQFYPPFEIGLERTCTALYAWKNNYEHLFSSEVEVLLKESGCEYAKHDVDLRREDRRGNHPTIDVLGDYDVIGLNTTQKRIFIIECKVLQPIGSVFEHSNQQKRFFTKEKFDEKFQKRIDYFSKVAMSFFANHGYDTEGFTINPYMVVNKVFSSYYKHVQFPIVTFDELKREIQL